MYAYKLIGHDGVGYKFGDTIRSTESKPGENIHQWKRTYPATRFSE